MLVNGNVIQYEPKCPPKLMTSARDLIHSYTDDFDKRGDGLKRYFSSGINLLDQKLGPWLHEGHLLIVAGRPKMGKSLFTQQVCEHLAEDHTCIYFSLEMSGHELIERSISRRSSISVQILKKYSQPNDLTKDEYNRFTQATADIAQINMLVDDNTYPLEEIISKTHKTFNTLKTHGLPRLGVVIVDYLQIVETNANGQANRSLALGEVSRALKRLAKELSIPVIAVSQLSRSLENRVDKRPLLSDLRESGNLEQDADLVLMIYRDELYNERTLDPGIAEFITRKNRHGPDNITVKVPFSGESMSIGKAFNKQSACESGYTETKRFEPTQDVEDNDADW